MIAEKDKAFPYFERSERTERNEEIKALYKQVKKGELFSSKCKNIFARSIAKDAKVLDLGSSSGRIFTVFSELGITDTHGADIADYLTMDRPNGSFKTFDFSADHFPYSDAEFDAITNIEVIEHLENPYHFLRECARILKKEGTLIVSTPNVDHLYNRITFFLRGRFYRFLNGNDHIMPFADYVVFKGAGKYFSLEKKEYLFGEMPYRIFSKFSYPENKFFGRTAFFIFKKK